MRLCLINFIVLVSLWMAPAQAQLQNAEARKFDEFGDIQSSDLKARLDNFAVQLSNEPTTKGFIVTYRSRRDLPGLSNSLAIRSKEYLVNARGFAADRIATVDGGEADCLAQELWIVPPGTAPKPRADAYQRYFPDVDSPRKIDEFGYDLRLPNKRTASVYPTEADYLETFANELRRQKTALAYIVGYAHYSKKRQLIGDENYDVYYETRIDPPKSLRSRLNFEKQTLVRSYGISPNRIRLVNGGYRKWRTLEFWIVPRGAHPPVPTPNSFPRGRGRR
ncbi:MAG TPA: hypothetical protein VGP81_10295 [Pyrinomonadaceae bacterium]|nr:hypothetical protein [Pyrinomonadaceae bacterium]